MCFVFLFLLFVSPFSLCPSSSSVAKNSALLLNEKEISFVPSFKRRDLVSFCFFVGGNVSFTPYKLEILSLTNIIMFALTTQFAGVQVVSKTNAPKKSVNKVVSVSNKVFSHVVYPPRSRERRMTTLSDEFSFFLPFSRWIISPRDEMISRCHLLY